jgi:catalase
MQTASGYLLFSPEVETIASDEHTTFEELSRTMQHITRHMATRYRHAYRPVHAKSHGVLVGTFEVLPDLPPELAQGLFAKPTTHPVIMRFSTNPGDLLADNVSSPRGLAIKILNVEGLKVGTHVDKSTQDFVCINANAFTAPDPKGFLGRSSCSIKTSTLLKA